MKVSLLWLLFGIAVFYFAAMLYAIYRGRDFRALVKVPFAALSFETREPGSSTEVGEGKAHSPSKGPTPLIVSRPPD